MSKKLASAILGATLATASPAEAKKHCGSWLWDENTCNYEFVPYFKCVGDDYKERPPHPPHPTHPPHPPTNAGGGSGHHGHHHEDVPIPKPKPEPHEPELLKKFNEGLHGQENEKEKLFRKFEEDLNKKKYPEIE